MADLERHEVLAADFTQPNWRDLEQLLADPHLDILHRASPAGFTVADVQAAFRRLAKPSRWWWHGGINSVR